MTRDKRSNASLTVAHIACIPVGIIPKNVFDFCYSLTGFSILLIDTRVLTDFILVFIREINFSSLGLSLLLVLISLALSLALLLVLRLVMRVMWWGDC